MLLKSLISQSPFCWGGGGGGGGEVEVGSSNFPVV